MKFCLRKALSIAAVFSFLMLAACFEPSTEETGEGYFTINLNVRENMRAVYPPTDTSDLRFVARFKETASGAERTYTSDGSKSIQGKIDTGNYIVTLDVSLISDGSPYARGVGYDNPVKIGSGKNQVKVHAFDVKNAEPPVISAKPQGRTYSFGDTKPALEVSASVKDHGVISYQWYSNTTNSNSGGTAIAGATLSTYMPSTTTPGTTWHYVAVTNTSTGKPTTISTVPVAIVVGDNPGSGGPSTGTGTVDDPFLVYDVASLQKVGSGRDGWSLGAYYKQTADIVLPQVSQGGSNWTPIGRNKDTTPFNGSYDGNNKTISNLIINAPTDEDSKGLFGRIDPRAVVKNVGLVNCSIVGSVAVGGVVGYNIGTVQNCYATGNVSGYVEVGGVVGINHGTVQYCYTTGDVSSDYGYVGGVVGENVGTVERCYATGNILGTGWAGGVVGLNSGTMQYCYATGSVSGFGAIGGVAGENYSGDNYYGTIQNCYATGNVSGDYSIGGVAGSNGGTIQNCYATGNVSGDNKIGGVAGSNGATIQNCYATGNVSGGSEIGGVVGLNNGNSGTVQNCVALNPNVSATGTYIGRVVGSLNTSDGSPIMANNYGRSDMKANGNDTTWTRDNDRDGESITSSNWGNQSWWTTASNWDTVGWNFSTVWQWGSNNLPILRNMPGTATQNPAVK